MRILLGVGVLTWPRDERVSDRYGQVYLIDTPGGKPSKSIDLVKLPEEQLGRLVCVVQETRESYHIGDFFRGIGPTTPKVGAEIVLGYGRLFYQHNQFSIGVGLRPEEARESDWLDPHQLYQVHDQTVELYFEPR